MSIREDHRDREACANELFERKDLLNNQRSWYDQRASHNKKWMQRAGVTTVAAGASTAVVQLWAPSPPDTPVHWSTIATAILGAVVVLSKGIERIWSFDDNWRSYRAASEAMKHERRGYLTATGPYRSLDDHEAFLTFVERVESIIAEEQNAFWGSRSEPSAKAETQSPTTTP